MQVAHAMPTRQRWPVPPRGISDETRSSLCLVKFAAYLIGKEKASGAFAIPKYYFRFKPPNSKSLSSFCEKLFFVSREKENNVKRKTTTGINNLKRKGGVKT
jgi:hypothetical protein